MSIGTMSIRRGGWWPLPVFRETRGCPDRTPARKLYVEVTGVDGCGKTTQARYITRRLQEEGIRGCYFKSPVFDWVRDAIAVVGDDSYGADADQVTDRRIFAVSHRLEQYLLRQVFDGKIHERFLRDPGVRRVLQGAELPADVIVCQRGLFDFYAFPMAEGMPPGGIDDLLKPDRMWNGFAYKPGEFLVPDVLVHLDCSPEVSMSRIPKEDKWETVPFLRELRKVYHRILYDPQQLPPVLRSTHIIHVNSERAIPDVQRDIDARVLPHLAARVHGAAATVNARSASIRR